MATLLNKQNADIGTRVEDYLDDRIQTMADIDNVNDLLLKVREQQELLKQQLAQARADSAAAELAYNNHSTALMQRAERFQQEQKDIDNRLRSITQVNTSDGAIKIFESKMRKLKRLELAEGYARILNEIDSLGQQVHKNIRSDIKSALSSYDRMRTLENCLNIAQPAAEGAAPHLIDYVEKETKKVYAQLEADLTSAFNTILDKMSWPRKELNLASTILEDWNSQTSYLLDLQIPDLLEVSTSNAVMATSTPTSAILLPLQVMVKPLSQRFQYHFYGERPTNRLDKPEYFFSHVLDLIEQHSAFMNRFLQPILDEKMRQHTELEMAYPDAISAFISALLPMVSSKCLSLLPNITNQPQLLSHFIHEMMAFDVTLRDSWAYTPVPNIFVDWRGLTWEMLNTHGYFSTWLETEKNFALSRYKKIRDSPESSNIEYDGFESGRSKPTKGAIRVNDLLETITDRYRGLTSFSQKMKFLMEVQLAIFDDYHGYLHGALQAYLVSSHTAGRLIQGQNETDAGGLKGLETLSKIFGSAEYLERKMSDWSEDLFFLELWEELQTRARQNAGHGSVGQDLTVEDVAAKTSSTIRQPNDTSREDEGGALFDETASSYQRLRERSEAEIVRSLETSMRFAIRPMTRVSVWSSLSSGTAEIYSLPVSSALDSLLTSLGTLFDFLNKVIAKIALRRVTRQLCISLQREIYDNIILRNTFSIAGAMQLRRDVLAIEDVIDTSINIPGETRRNMRKLEDSLTLLNLPIKASSASRSFDTVHQADGTNGGDDDDIEDWGFTEDRPETTTSTSTEPDLADTTISAISSKNPISAIGDETGVATNKNQTAEANENNDDDNSWGLWEAEKAIFANNESARGALSDMGLDFINESEARVLIRRRIEINA